MEVANGENAAGAAEVSEYEELRLNTIKENQLILESIRQEQLLTSLKLEPKKRESADTEPLLKKRKIEAGEAGDPDDDEVAAEPSSSKTADIPEELCDLSIIQHSDEVRGNDENNNTLNESRAKNRRKRRRREEMDESAPRIELPKNRPNFYGPVPGIPVGRIWETRMESSYDGVMRPPVAGIHAGPEGAYSIALSGGYEDDIDWGHCFTYTGEGGKAVRRNRAYPNYFSFSQIRRDQELTRGNLALSLSVTSRNPVRVIRGAGLNNDFAPEYGYRYDGLYTVEKYWVATGKFGSKIFKFLFKRCSDQEQAPWISNENVDGECALEENMVDASKVVEASSGDEDKQTESIDVKKEKDSEGKSPEEFESKTEGDVTAATMEDRNVKQNEPIRNSEDVTATKKNDISAEDCIKLEVANENSTNGGNLS